MLGHFHLLRFARSEGAGGVGFADCFELEAGLRKLVMGGVDGGRKGPIPLMFQEKMRRLPAGDVEGTSEAGKGGRHEGGEGEGW